LGVGFVLSFEELKTMSLLSLAEGVAWICTRDREAVRKIAEVSVGDRLGVAMQRYGRGYEWHRPRAQLGKEIDCSPRWVGLDKGEHASSQQALTGLIAAISERHLPLYVFGDEGKYRPVQDLELHETEIRRCEDRRASCGLWNRKENRFVFLEPSIDLNDLQRLWPGIAVPGSIRTTKNILAALLAATEDGRKLKKDDALALAMKLEDFGRRRFEEAWREFPAERKCPRGKRGPSKKAA
jgi:hypothetical protein